MSKSGPLRLVATSWNKDKVSDERKVSHQDVKTNQVEETKQELLKRTAAGSGRNTPVPPERHGKPAVHLSTWTGEQLEESGSKLLRYEGVHTNQVQETIHELGKKSGDSGRTTPVPSRHIGEVFAENKIGAEWKVKQKEDPAPARSGSSPWRSAAKTQEPTLKLVNVSVEKSATGGANIHISENAHTQMANFMQQESKRESSKVASSSSAMTSQKSMTSSMSMTVQQKSEQMSTKTATTASEQKSMTSSSAVEQRSAVSSTSAIKSMTPSASLEQKSVMSSMEQKSMTSSMDQKSMTSSMEQKSMTASMEQKSMTSSPPTDTRLVQVPPKSPGPIRSAKITSAKDKGKTETPGPIQQQQQQQQQPQQQQPLKGSVSKAGPELDRKPEAPQESKPTKPSSSSSASSCPIPMPVTQSWFEQQEQQHQSSSTSTTATTLSSSASSKVQTQAQTATTPLPVLAGWFEEEEKQSKIKKSSPAEKEPEKPKPPSPSKPVKLVEPEKPVRLVEPPKLPTKIPEPKPVVKIPDAPKPPTPVAKAAETVKAEEIQRIEIVDITNEKSNETELADAIKGKVRGNIAMFQGSCGKSPSGGNLAQEAQESMRGIVGESRKAYIQRASSTDREDSGKQQRAFELEAMLKARNESGSRSGYTSDDPERLFAQRQREERARELEEVAQMRATASGQSLWEETDAHSRAELSRVQRARELQELANMRSKKNWNEVVASGGHNLEAEDLEETERQRRARELQELTSSKSRKVWDETLVSEEGRRQATKTPDPELELDEARSSIRSTAKAWQERDRASSRTDTHDGQARASPSTPTPSRRIGNLFSRNSDHWQMQDYDDEFPAPPTAEEVGVAAHNLPAPPPRDSSKEYMNEFRGGSNQQRSKY